MIGRAIRKLETTDTNKTLYQGSFNTPIPYGIDPRDSMIGTIDIHITRI